MKQVAAVVGAGFVGKAHIEALRRLPVPVRGTLVSSGERSAAAAKALGLEHAYTSVDEIAADPDITVVHICTPNYVHFEQTAKLLRAGKHVLCEKPLAMDSRESATLVALAKETNRVGGVAHNLRYYPLCIQARALIESGAIGQVKLVHGGFLQDWLTYPADWNWRLESKLGGELRAVSDIGTHWLDLIQWITGQRVEELCADLATVGPVRHKPRAHTLRTPAVTPRVTPTLSCSCSTIITTISRRGISRRRESFQLSPPAMKSSCSAKPSRRAPRIVPGQN